MASTVPHAYQNTMLIAAVLPIGVSVPTRRDGEKLAPEHVDQRPADQTGRASGYCPAASAISRGRPVGQACSRSLETGTRAGQDRHDGDRPGGLMTP